MGSLCRWLTAPQHPNSPWRSYPGMLWLTGSRYHMSHTGQKPGSQSNKKDHPGKLTARVGIPQGVCLRAAAHSAGLWVLMFAGCTCQVVYVRWNLGSLVFHQCYPLSTNIIIVIIIIKLSLSYSMKNDLNVSSYCCFSWSCPNHLLPDSAKPIWSYLNFTVNDI